MKLTNITWSTEKSRDNGNQKWNSEVRFVRFPYI